MRDFCNHPQDVRNKIKEKLFNCEIYNFLDYDSDVKTLIHAINLLGDNLIGVEVGVYKGESFCTMLQTCPSIETLYGIDNWKSYTDYLKTPYDGTPNYTVSKPDIELIRFTALNHIKYSGFENKAKIIEMDSTLAASKFEDNFFDFVFIDTYMTYEQCCQDLKDWYPKLKVGGIFSGHDWDVDVVQDAVLNFRASNSINSTLSIFDKIFSWKKK